MGKLHRCGLSGAKGNARTNTFAIAVATSRETRTDKTAAYFKQIYSSALVDGVSAATAEAIRGGWSYHRNIKPTTDLGPFERLRIRPFSEPGFTSRPWQRSGVNDDQARAQALDLLGGAAYNHEEFDTPLIRNSAEAYWGDDFTYKPSRITELQQRLRVFHNLSDPGSYRVNFDMSVAMNLNSWLAWHLTLSDRLLSEPVAGRQRNDVLYTAGLRLRFAR